MIKIVKDTFVHFINSNSSQQSAALAYYTVFSMLPIIMILMSFLGIFFGDQAVSGEISKQLNDALGTNASLKIQDLIKNQHIHHNNIFTSVISFIVLAFSASGLFSQVHTTFNSIWNIKEKPRNGILKYLSKHFISITLLVGLFAMILASTFVNSFLIKHSHELHLDYKFYFLYEHLISFIILSLAFGIMFKYLGDAIIHWKAILSGGLFTAILFMVGKIGIGMYLAHSHISSTFGSASALVLLMLWVYYLSQIIFLGASFVKIISGKLGYKILPTSNSVMIESREIEV